MVEIRPGQGRLRATFGKAALATSAFNCLKRAYLIMRTTLALLGSLTLAVCAASAAAAPNSSIHALTPEEFSRAGLNKLTPEELLFLDEALIHHQQLVAKEAPAKPADKVVMSTDKDSAAFGAEQVAKKAPAKPVEQVVKSTDKAAATFGAEQVVKEKPVVSDQELHAHIEGTIESFTGRAVFVLDNGQIWQQRMPETVYFTPKLVNPEVIITRGFIGYKMLIVPANRIVFVKRIQ